MEKCDDGYSGVHFESRPQFAELMEPVKSGKVNCIPDNYDSKDFEGTTGGLDAAFKNMIFPAGNENLWRW